MSLIKQVQDLEKRLHQVRSTIDEMRRMKQYGVHSEAATRAHQPALPTMEGFEHVRVNLRNICKGIYTSPPPSRVPAEQPLYGQSDTPLPPK